MSESKVAIGACNAGDPFYRYKRDAVKLSPAPANRTHFMNVDALCAQLRCDRAFMIRFLQKRLAKPITVSKDSAPKILLGGRMPQAELEAALEAFIEKHILCGRCAKPERNKNTGQCDACGHPNPPTATKKSPKKSTQKSTKKEKDGERKDGERKDGERKDGGLEGEIAGFIEKLYEKRDKNPDLAGRASTLIDQCWNCADRAAWQQTLLPAVLSFLS